MLPFLVFRSLNRNFETGVSKLLMLGNKNKKRFFILYSAHLIVTLQIQKDK